MMQRALRISIFSLLCASLVLAAPPTEWVAKTVTYAKCTGVNGSSNPANTGSGSDFAHSLTCSVDANAIRANTLIRACAQWNITTDTVAPNVLLKLKAGSTTLYAGTATTPTPSITNKNVETCWLTVAGADPSGSSATYTSIEAYPSAITGTLDSNTVAQPVNLATNGALTWGVTSQWVTSGTATNVIKVNSFTVELLNNR